MIPGQDDLRWWILTEECLASPLRGLAGGSNRILIKAEVFRGIAGFQVSKGIEFHKFWNLTERRGERPYGFANLVDVLRDSIAKKPCPFPNMRDPPGVEAHQSGAGGVRCYWIVSQHNPFQKPRSTVERTVALHGDDAVGDHKVDRNRCAQIENALLNAFPMQDILWSSVPRAGDNSKHVLHSERHARPVVRLDLRH